MMTGQHVQIDIEAKQLDEHYQRHLAQVLAFKANDCKEWVRVSEAIALQTL